MVLQVKVIVLQVTVTASKVKVIILFRFPRFSGVANDGYGAASNGYVVARTGDTVARTSYVVASDGYGVMVSPVGIPERNTGLMLGPIDGVTMVLQWCHIVVTLWLH
jgi:hypothetical protein